jgi:glutathione synthase/RimK-type ligase-like ATP-grasp enzyme
VPRSPQRTERGSGIRIAVVYDRLRPEERLLFEAFERLGVAFERLYAPALRFALDEPLPAFDVVIERCLSQTRGAALSRLFTAGGALVVNRPEVIELCGDKLATSARLAQVGVPTPRTGIAFNPAGAHELGERFGFPVVLKWLAPGAGWSRCYATPMRSTPFWNTSGCSAARSISTSTSRSTSKSRVAICESS